MENDDFDGFFASPDNVNRLSEGYYGCFAVDLTDYVNTPESRRLSELFEYMKERREITFVLFASDDESGAAVAFAESVKRRTTWDSNRIRPFRKSQLYSSGQQGVV